MTILIQGRCRSSSVTRFYSERSRRVDLDAISAGILSMSNGVLRGEGSYSLTSVAFSEGKKGRGAAGRFLSYGTLSH